MKEQAKHRRAGAFPRDEALVCTDTLTVAAICWLGNKRYIEKPSLKAISPYEFKLIHALFGPLEETCLPVGFLGHSTRGKAAKLSQPQPARMEKSQYRMGSRVLSTFSDAAHGQFKDPNLSIQCRKK